MQALRIGALTVASCAVGLACESERKAERPAVEDVQAKVQDAARAALDYVAGAKDTYVAEAEQELEAIGAKIRALEAEAAKAGTELRRDIAAQLRALEAKKSELLRKLGDMKAHRAKIDAQLEQLDASLDDMSTRLSELRKQASAANDEARGRIQGEIDALTRRRDELTKEFEQLKASSREAWGTMREGLDSALGELRTSYEKAAERFE